MDLLDLLKLMFRRWYVCGPLVLLAVGAAFAYGTAVEPEYKTSAAILLVPPTVTGATSNPDGSAQPANPWLRIGENGMAQAIQISTSAHGARARVAAAGGESDYEVGLVSRSAILTVNVVADTEANARATVTAVIRLIQEEVAGQQSRYGTAPEEQIGTEVLDPGTQITASRANLLRAQIVLIAIGVLLAAAAAVLVDALARGRTARRPTGPDPAAPVQTGPEPTPPSARRSPEAPTNTRFRGASGGRRRAADLKDRPADHGERDVTEPTSSGGPTGGIGPSDRDDPA